MAKIIDDINFPNHHIRCSLCTTTADKTRFIIEINAVYICDTCIKYLSKSAAQINKLRKTIPADRSNVIPIEDIPKGD